LTLALPLILAAPVGAAALAAVLTVRFSPYEAFRLSGEPQRVGLIAFVDDPKTDVSATVAAAGATGPGAADLEQAGITNLNLFVRELHGRRAVFAYFETPRKGIDGLDTVLGATSPAVRELERVLSPHPRAEPGSVWLRMEWINLLGTTTAFPHAKPADPPHHHTRVQPMGMVAGLKPECEPVYRQLHQNNWPGVIDAMVRAHHRNWTTFLVELDDGLFLFTYAEYTGTDREADAARVAADPSTQRWWKQTEPCLIDLHGEGNWSPMARLDG